MASAKQDFERFVRWLYGAERRSSADVRRFANLLLANFEELAGTSRQRSQRSVYIVELMRRALAGVADEAPSHDVDNAEGDWTWTRLRSLTLGPFRGFRTPESFDLTKQIILIYGPNGAGKTSLCEGLEYALLGEVEEASAKRIAAQTYLKNIHARRFDAPVLKAADKKGREVDVVANPDTYRFCFIEKNRIDAFSRIAAKPNAQRAELVATLFGMDQFSEFVSHFNESIDGQLILNGEKQTSLAARQAALAVDQATVKDEGVASQRLHDEEAVLAESFAPGTTYAGLKLLFGSVDAPGRLQELDSILSSVPPVIIGITRAGVLEAFERAYECAVKLSEIKAALAAKSDQVSFKGLYESVLALRQSVGDRCPACDTPLDGPSHVATNPYDKADEGLIRLQELGVLQERQRIANSAEIEASREIRRLLGKIGDFAAAQNEQETPIGRYLAQLPAEPASGLWAEIYPKSHKEQPPTRTLEQILSLADRIAAQDDASRRAGAERQLRNAERQRLIDFQLKVQAQDLKRQQLRQSVEEAKQRISQFNENNSVLIEQAAQEKKNIERDRPFKALYDNFLLELRSYREQLPAQLMAGLNDTAKELYNAFNRNDRDEDKLATLHLPLTGDGKIEISFRGKPDSRVDALHVLSEGHVRCLGLAILLAKAKSIKCPLIVFDDAINAIDHDHRGGIRETIFESEYFAEIQVIVTCHSNEFIKDIQQHLPAERRNGCKVYLLRHHNGDYQPRVGRNIQSANYIDKARAEHDQLNDRGALAAARQALEMLSQKTWKWLGSHEQGTLSLKISGPNSEPQLRGLCESLLKRLNEAETFEHINKAPLKLAYGRILGIPADNLVWMYLNKGTHEEADRDDFDSEIVESVIQTLSELASLDLRDGR